MNNVGFNYGSMGLKNLDALANTEQQRLEMEREMRRELKAAEAQGIGELVGTAVGGARGYYNKRKDQHDAAHSQEREDWRGQVLNQKIEQAQNQVEHKYDPRIPERTFEDIPAPKKKDFDFLAAVHKDLADIGWVDP
jgi:hypothetical protein